MSCRECWGFYCAVWEGDGDGRAGGDGCVVISLLGITEVTNDSTALTPDKMVLITPVKTEQKTNDAT